MEHHGQIQARLMKLLQVHIEMKMPPDIHIISVALLKLLVKPFIVLRLVLRRFQIN